jgi:hypothetical protein
LGNKTRKYELLGRKNEFFVDEKVIKFRQIKAKLARISEESIELLILTQ